MLDTILLAKQKKKTENVIYHYKHFLNNQRLLASDDNKLYFIQRDNCTVGPCDIP
jgi:hypothetical protein